MFQPDASLIPTLLSYYEQNVAARNAALAMIDAEYGDRAAATAAGVSYNELLNTSQKFALDVWKFYVGQRKTPPSPGDLTPAQANMLIEHMQTSLAVFLETVGAEIAAIGP